MPPGVDSKSTGRKAMHNGVGLTRMGRMSRVTTDDVLKLHLEHIGGLYGANEYNFKRGLNLVVAPNAAGKSSLVRGWMSLLMDEDALSSQEHFLHSFETVGRAEALWPDGTRWWRRLNRRPAGNKVGVSGEPAHPDGRKVTAFTIASEENELIRLAKSDRSLDRLLLLFSDYHVWRALGKLIQERLEDIAREKAGQGQARQELYSHRKRLVDLEQKYKEVEARLKARPPLRADDRLRAVEAEKNLNDKEEAFKAVDKELVSLEGQMTDQEDRIKRSEARRERFIQDLEYMKTKQVEWNQRLDQIVSELRDINQELDTKQAAQAILQGQMRLTSENIENFRREDIEKCYACGQQMTLETLHRRLDELRRDLREIGADINQLSERRFRLQREKDRIREDRSRLQERTKDADEIDRELRAAREKLESLKAQVSRCREQRQAAQREYEAAQKGLPGDLVKDITERNALERSLTRLEEQMRIARRRIDELKDVEDLLRDLRRREQHDVALQQLVEERKQRVAQVVRDRFNEQIREVWGRLEFDPDLHDIYLDDDFHIRILRRFPGREKTMQVGIATLSKGEQETVALVLMLAGKQAYLPEFPLFVADETTFYDQTRFRRMAEFIAEHIPYTIITTLAPKEEQNELEIKYGLVG